MPETPITIMGIQRGTGAIPYLVEKNNNYHDYVLEDMWINPLEISNFIMLPIFYYYKNTNGPGVTRIQFIISGFTTPDPIADAALIASYNGIKTLTKLQDNLFAHPIDISGSSIVEPEPDPESEPVLFGTPINITFLYNPRLTTALELVDTD